MPIFGGLDQANNAPKAMQFGGGNTTGTAMYVNTTPSAFISGVTMGVFGVDRTEAANGHINGKGTLSPGWVRATFGQGPVKSVTLVSGGTGYSNTDTVKISGGITNAVATMVTNATGGITTIALTTPGLFVNTATVSFANSTAGVSAGSGANVTYTLGGRAGRAQFETLAFVRISTDNAADNATFP